MSSLKIILPLLALPLCSSFAPLHRSTASRSSIGATQQSHVLRAAAGDDNTNNLLGENEELVRVGKAAGAALAALTLSFSAITAPAPFSMDGISSVPSANAAAPSSLMIASRKDLDTVNEEIIKDLEQETRKEEKLAKKDKQKAKVEASRERFFEYEAKMAELTEARIEAAEKQAELEFEKDKKEAEELLAAEKKAEREAALAQTKEEKAAKQKEARALLKKEKEVERKEKAAERREKIFLAEEQQEKKILQQKEDAAIAEEKRYEEVEKEYERVAELAKEEELELKLMKGFSPKKK